MRKIQIEIQATDTYCQSGDNWKDELCPRLFSGQCMVFKKHLTSLSIDKITYFIRCQQCLDAEVKE